MFPLFDLWRKARVCGSGLVAMRCVCVCVWLLLLLGRSSVLGGVTLKLASCVAFVFVNFIANAKVGGCTSVWSVGGGCVCFCFSQRDTTEAFSSTQLPPLKYFAVGKKEKNSQP